jgi:pimeloyl-ACP methyl ester carboxylesterase
VMRRLWAGPVLATLLLCEASAVDRGPPHGASLDATRENVGHIVNLLRRQGTGLGLEDSLVDGVKDCDRWQTEACDASAARACSDSLARVFDALAPDLPEIPLAADGGDVIEGARRSAAMEVAGTLSRISWLTRPTPDSDCRRVAPGTMVPAELVLHADLRTFDLRPLVPLEAGGRYRVLASGMSAEHRARLAASLRRDTDPRARKRELEATFAPPEAEGAGQIDVAALRQLLTAISGASVSGGKAGVLSGVQATVNRPWRGAELASLRLGFEAGAAEEGEESVGEIETLDPTREISRPEAPCRVLSAGHSSDPDILAGRATVRSQGEQVSFLLALPTGADATTALVIGIDGHQGSAARMMERHRSGVVGRGMALLTLDIPFHGDRARSGVDFVPLLDPAQLTSNFRQAVAEILSVIADARGCGFELGESRHWKPSEIRYLGYSLGSLLGTAVRAMDPELGATVLLAPGGDLFSWLQLRIGPEVGTTFVRCLGGPTAGEPCHATGACQAPGVCIVAPDYAAMVRLLEHAWGRATARAEPLAFASLRRGGSRAPLLLIVGREDPVFHPALVRRLADAYEMRPTAPGVLRGPGSTMAVWPDQMHDLDSPPIQAQAYGFLERATRVGPEARTAPVPRHPAWYEIFQPARR